MQNWVDLYLELGELLAEKVDGVRWIDLWNNQVNFLSDEFPFPTPAIFLGFRILSVQDQGQKVQKVTLQVDTYVFFETFSDMSRGSLNRGSAVEFLKMINDSYAVLHGSAGANYSNMRRIGFGAVDTGGAGNLYLQSYSCELVDYSAMKEYVDGEIEDIEMQRGDINVSPPEGGEPMFIIGT